MSRRAFPAAAMAVASLLLARAAAAQDAPVTTTPVGSDAPLGAAKDDPVAALQAIPETDPELEDGTAPLERKIHGAISVGVGTGGYRSVDAEATVPVGKEGSVGVLIDQTNIGRSRR